MVCFAYSSNDSYKYRLAKTRKNVLNNLYEKEAIKTQPKKLQSDNLRLHLRFKEAIEEAEEICSTDKNSKECHFAWYEVDELEDSIARWYHRHDSQ
tara:strand:+ start:832 stop:1119 length:288 start_codon:yes stop_codon:yes gene_type:complete